MVNKTPSGPSARDGAMRGPIDHPVVLAALVLAAAIPLLLPDVPPLTDLVGHLGRYRIEIDGASSPSLARFYRFEWALIGNLGVDLLVVPLSALFGLELAVKLIVLAIPPLTVAGFLWTAHAAHGRVPPTALFALPLAYSHPFHFGFANFALSIALAFLALGLWLRLRGRPRLRAALFVPISLALWVTHIFGWGILGLLAFAAEWARMRETGRPLLSSIGRAALGCLPLAPPLVLMILWRSGEVTGDTGDWLNLPVKFLYLAKSLGDRWMEFDVAAVAVIGFVIALGVRGRPLEWSRALAGGAVLLALVYLAMPRVLLGSAYADMRLAPYMLAVALLALRPRPDAGPAFVRALVIAGLGFFLVRTAATTASLAAYDRRFTAELAALDRLPRGARVAAFVGKPCHRTWAASRLDHLPALAVVRREAFSNDQWTMAGAQLLRARLDAPGFTSDPSQQVVPSGCRHPEWRTLDDALRLVPRRAFDHIWLIDPPAYDKRLTAGLTPVWARGTSVLFRIEPAAAAR